MNDPEVLRLFRRMEELRNRGPGRYVGRRVWHSRPFGERLAYILRMAGILDRALDKGRGEGSTDAQATAETRALISIGSHVMRVRRERPDRRGSGLLGCGGRRASDEHILQLFSHRYRLR